MAHKIESLLQDKPALHLLVEQGFIRALERQKASGKEFITDEDIDSLIDQIIQEELNKKENGENS